MISWWFGWRLMPAHSVKTVESCLEVFAAFARKKARIKVFLDLILAGRRGGRVALPPYRFARNAARSIAAAAGAG
jgi:hypothetical protein